MSDPAMQALLARLDERAIEREAQETAARSERFHAVLRVAASHPLVTDRLKDWSEDEQAALSEVFAQVFKAGVQTGREELVAAAHEIADAIGGGES